MAASDTKHSFFVAGPNFTGIISEDGQPVWDTGRRYGRDGWVLPNGNILVCWSNLIREYRGRTQELTWEYERSGETSGRANFLGCLQRLSDGATLVYLQPQILEITPDKKISKRIPGRGVQHLPCSYYVRKLDNGNYLATELVPNGNLLVVELDASGKVVRTVDTGISNRGHHAYHAEPLTAAVQLPTGNLLILSQFANCLKELDQAGKTVWELSNKDFEQPLLHHVSSLQRLPNGNTVIGNYRHRAEREGVKLVEVTADKQVVWTYEGDQRVTSFQILTTNGKPVPGPVLR